jgi:hypothetical protein
MLIRTRNTVIENIPSAGLFVRLGRLSLWLERTGHRPARLIERWRDTDGSLHVFALGRRLIVSSER